jgi:hypothetical protein
MHTALCIELVFPKLGGLLIDIAGQRAIIRVRHRLLCLSNPERKYNASYGRETRGRIYEDDASSITSEK